jgi:hypothetical protein
MVLNNLKTNKIMKTTAVEFALEQLEQLIPSGHQLAIRIILDQAKEIEKQQQGYSEEEVYHILCEHTAFLFAGGKSTLTEWFEKFKNK